MTDLEFENMKLQKELERLEKFKRFFDDLYGIGLEVKNFHIYGSSESFDNIYESAIMEMDE